MAAVAFLGVFALLLNYFCFEVEAQLVRGNNTIVTNTIPAGVECKESIWCATDSSGTNVCSIVCERGSVFIDPLLQAAIKTQNYLAYNQDMCHAVLQGSHNAAISLAEGYGNSDVQWTAFVQKIDKNLFVRTNDQYLSLTDLLRLGVRMIELDTHWVKDELRIAHCGGFHVKDVDNFLAWAQDVAKRLNLTLPDWDTETVGCSPSLSAIPAGRQRSLLDAFTEIAAWLYDSANANEFLIAFFDDQMDLNEWGKVPLLIETINMVFNDTVYTPVDYYANGGWPASISDMIASGKRILFNSGADYSTNMSSTIFYKYGPELCNWTEPDLDQFKCDSPQCLLATQEGSSTYVPTQSGQIIRPETSEIVYGPFSTFDPSKVLTEETIPPLAACATNFISPDLITPNRSMAYIWSWGPQQPASFSDCASATSAGPWATTSCASSLLAACKNVTRTSPPDSSLWGLSVSASVYGLASCPPGFTFSPPYNGLENALLVQTMQARSIASAWVSFDMSVLV